MSSTKILQMLSVENGGESRLVFSRLSLQQINFPDSLFDPHMQIPDQYCGIFPPVIVCKTGPDYSILDGCKRFVLMQRKKIGEAEFAVLESDCDSLTSGLLRISLNRGRILQLREKILFVKWLKDNLDSEDYKTAVSELGITARERHELEQLSDCPPDIADAVDRGVADPGLAPDLKLMAPEDYLACLRLLSRTGFSRQQQRELIEWLPEIAYSKNRSIGEVLCDGRLVDILENGSINQPQKAQKVRDFVFQKRFPHLVDLKKKWSELARKANPDPLNIHFTVSEAFEKNRLEVRVLLTEPQKAGEIFAGLGLISGETWEKLIYPAAGP